MLKYEEKIKLMLESIITDVELIEKNTRGLDVKALKKELKAISQKAGASVPNRTGLEALEQKVTDIQNSLTGSTGFSKQVNNHHYFWFFPDLKEWLQLARRGLPLMVLAIISLLLAGFMAFKYTDYQTYRDNSYKYQYLYYASQDEDQFRNYEQEWTLDSIKQARIQWVDLHDSQMKSEIGKNEQKLQQQLDSLKTN